jgi:2-polyprenyl-3-methyl-5-hydroxy-6-metoxy-1,4-benzoquinol methylase
VKCLVCSADGPFTRLSPELCSADNWLCGSCGLVFIPRGEHRSGEYYKEDGYYERSPNLAARSFFTSRKMLNDSARERVERMETLLPGGTAGKRVLDVGCGRGEILHFLQAARQCEVLGLEPSANAASAGGQLFPIRIVPALFEEGDLAAERFDLVLCNHTLEHVEDPRRFLGLLKNSLAPGGLLYVEVPNVLWPSGGFTLEAFLYDEHLQTFSASNLAMLVEQCGFTIRAYSDSDFLRFVCSAEGGTPAVKVDPIPAQRVESFLRQYKAGYSMVQHGRVYAGKAGYLMRLCYSKVCDRLGVQ